MLALKQEDFKLYGEKGGIIVESEYILESEEKVDKTILFNLNANNINFTFKITRQQIKDLAEILTELSKLI